MTEEKYDYTMPDGGELHPTNTKAQVAGNVAAFLGENLTREALHSKDDCYWIGRLYAGDQQRLFGKKYGKRVFKLMPGAYAHFRAPNGIPTDVKRISLTGEDRGSSEFEQIVEAQVEQDQPEQDQPAEGNQAERLAQALSEVLTGGMTDETKVRKIAAEVTAAAIRDMEPPKVEHVIQIPDRDNLKIEGHVHPDFDTVLRMVKAGLNVMMVGPAGCGKSFLARQIAKALEMEYSDLSLTAGTAEYQLTGRLLPTGEGGRFEYHPSPFVNIYENGGVFLLDEMDAADPNMLVVVNNALANGGFTNETRSHAPEFVRHDEAYVIAAANTYGNGAEGLYAGRNALDGATLNRFTIVEMDYDTELEKSFASDSMVTWCWEIRDRIKDAGLERIMSTRDIEKAGRLEQAGFKKGFIEQTLLAGWNQDELAQVRRG